MGESITVNVVDNSLLTSRAVNEHDFLTEGSLHIHICRIKDLLGRDSEWSFHWAPECRTRWLTSHHLAAWTARTKFFGALPLDVLPVSTVLEADSVFEPHLLF